MAREILSVRMTPDLAVEIEALVAASGKSRSVLVREGLRLLLKPLSGAV